MLKILSFVVLLSFACIAQASDKEGRVRYNAGTGDTNLDLSLGKLNLKADGNINDFISALGFEYKVPTTKIKSLIVDYNFSPADAYMTVSIGNLSGRSVDEVADLYRANKAGGWGNVAKRMGIKPGSKEFHQLKNGSKNLSAEDEAESSSNNKNKKNTKARGKDNNKGQGKNKGKKDY